MEQLQSSFEVFSINQVPKNKNAHTDSLATLAISLGEGLPRVIIVEDLVAPNWDSQVPIGINKIHVGLNWMNPMVSFLKDRTLPKDKTKAKKVLRKAPRY